MPEDAAISGLDDASQARVRLLQSGRAVHAPVLGIGLQPLDADLTAIAALTTTAYGRALLTMADAAATRTALGLGSAATQELTPWVFYTPTFTGFGTAANVSIESRRVGDTLEMMGKFTSGTVAGVEARMTLGFNGTNANVTSDATKVPTIRLAGTGALGNATTTMLVVLIESNVGYVTFGYQGATAGLTKLLGTGFGSTVTVSFTAQIPITGW